MSNDSTQKLSLPFQGSWWIEEGRVIGGRFPGAYEECEEQDKLEATERLIALVEAKVGLVINLQDPKDRFFGSGFEDYKPFLRAFANNHDHQISFASFPISDFSTPDKKTVQDALDAIDDAIASGKLVYMHCHGGHGRTGTIAGCLLRRRGLSPSQALRKIQMQRAHDRSLAHHASPETDGQIKVIENWDPFD